MGQNLPQSASSLHLPGLESVRLFDQSITWPDGRRAPPSPSADAWTAIKVPAETFSRSSKKEELKKKRSRSTSKGLLMFALCFFAGHSCISSVVENSGSETILDTMAAGASLKLNTSASRAASPLMACYTPLHTHTHTPVGVMLILGRATGNTKQLFPPTDTSR